MLQSDTPAKPSQNERRKNKKRRNIDRGFYTRISGEKVKNTNVCRSSMPFRLALSWKRRNNVGSITCVLYILCTQRWRFHNVIETLIFPLRSSTNFEKCSGNETERCCLLSTGFVHEFVCFCNISNAKKKGESKQWPKKSDNQSTKQKTCRAAFITRGLNRQPTKHAEAIFNYIMREEVILRAER